METKRGLVCVVCPTYGRQRFLPLVVHQFQMQDYDRDDRMLLIYDDSPSSSSMELWTGCDMTNVVYIHSVDKMTIYEKRNELNRLAVEKYGAEYVVCMDDDDLYLPTRVSDAVKELRRNMDTTEGAGAVIMGSAVLPLLYVDTGDIYEVRVSKPNYASNNTMAYTKEYVSTHRHVPSPDHPSQQNRNEEESFTNGFKEPMRQCRNVVLMVCHGANTVGKSPFRTRKNLVTGRRRDMLLRSFLGDDPVKRDFYARHFPRVTKKLPMSSS